VALAGNAAQGLADLVTDVEEVAAMWDKAWILMMMRSSGRGEPVAHSSGWRNTPEIIHSISNSAVTFRGPQLNPLQ
jgi:hypothetical protein